jgi:uncharacterized protein YraI
MTRARFFGVWVVLGLIISAAAAAETAYTNRTVSLRAGPGSEYPVVERVGRGEAVEVAGCVDGWSWCDVIAGPDRGWVYGGSLEYPYEGRRVSIFHHGGWMGLPIVAYSAGPYWDSYYRGRPWYGRRSYWVNRSPAFHSRSPMVRPVGPPGVHHSRPVNRPQAHVTGLRREVRSAPRREVARPRPQPERSRAVRPESKRPSNSGHGG